MLQLIYPASLAVVLVLLFDKATRGWSPKSSRAGLREWLYCDMLAFLLLLGFVNLLRSDDAGYATLLWDTLHIVLVFFLFWLLDRKLTRYRFLVALGYLTLLPLLLLWRTTQPEVPAGAGEAATLSWWVTIWPFVFLALIAFVLEIIALVAAREPERYALPVLKDVLFFVLYAILLINAIPPAVEMAQ